MGNLSYRQNELATSQLWLDLTLCLETFNIENYFDVSVFVFFVAQFWHSCVATSDSYNGNERSRSACLHYVFNLAGGSIQGKTWETASKLCILHISAVENLQSRPAIRVAFNSSFRTLSWINGAIFFMQIRKVAWMRVSCKAELAKQSRTHEAAGQ